MRISPQDQNTLEYLRKAKTTHRHLDALIRFYEQLFQLQFAFKARLKDDRYREHFEGRQIDPARLAAGFPQLGLDELRMEATPVMDLYRDIVPLLTRHMGFPGSDHGEPQEATILRRAQEIFERKVPLVGAGQPEDLIGVASGLVLAPYLQLACEYLMPRITQSAWHRGHCPVCGGGPSLAVVLADPGFRTLFCSRCNGEWLFRRMGCPFCLDRDRQTYYPSEKEGYRLYVCEACHRYLKSLESTGAASERCLPAEALLTVSMDVAAREKGWLFF